MIQRCQILKTFLMIQWSWWWSLHCRLGGPASTNQNQEFWLPTNWRTWFCQKSGAKYWKSLWWSNDRDDDHCIADWEVQHRQQPYDGRYRRAANTSLRVLQCLVIILILSSSLQVLQCLVIILTVNDIVIIIAARPKPSYVRQGLRARSFKRVHFGVFSTSRSAPPTLSSDLIIDVQFFGKGRKWWFLVSHRGPQLTLLKRWWLLTGVQTHLSRKSGDKRSHQ